MIDINITSKLCLESKTLTFTWEEVLGSTTTNYTILSSNCGSCPTTTTNTTVTCTDVPSDGGVCIFTVQTVVCGNTHLSGEILVMLIKGSVHTANSNILVVATSASLIVVCFLCASTFPIIYFIGKRIYRSRHEADSGESTITVKGNTCSPVYEDIGPKRMVSATINTSTTTINTSRNVAYGQPLH